jgi:hypothetical protein
MVIANGASAVARICGSAASILSPCSVVAATSLL